MLSVVSPSHIHVHIFFLSPIASCVHPPCHGTTTFPPSDADIAPSRLALRTGRSDFIETSRRLADVFLSHLGPSGVPLWDFSAPQPCPYDASAATIAARGMQMLYQLLLPTDSQAAEMYLSKGFKLVEDVMRECGTDRATLNGGKVNWGEGGWETLLKVSDGCADYALNANFGGPVVAGYWSGHG